MTVTDNRKNVKAQVEMKLPNGVEETFEEVVGVLTSDEPLANIGYSATFTKNLGNFESCRVGVTLNLPVPPNQEAVDRGFKLITDYVDAKMNEVLEEMDSLQDG